MSDAEIRSQVSSRMQAYDHQLLLTDALSWRESYVFRAYRQCDGGRSDEDASRNAADPAMSTKKCIEDADDREKDVFSAIPRKTRRVGEEIGDAFVLQGVGRSESDVNLYFDAALNWVRNCFRRGYLNWDDKQEKARSITRVVCGMIIAIDELTIPATTSELAKRIAASLKTAAGEMPPSVSWEKQWAPIAAGLGADAQTVKRMDRMGVKLGLQEALSNAREELSAKELSAARGCLAGLSDAEIAEWLRGIDPRWHDVTTDSVTCTLKAILRQHCLSGVDRSCLEPKNRAWIAKAIMGKTPQEIAAVHLVDVNEVEEFLEGQVREDYLSRLHREVDTLVDRRTLLLRAVAGYGSEPRDRESLLALARVLAGVKCRFRSQVGVLNAYSKGMAELQESWERDDACEMASSCLEWHDAGGLRGYWKCGFPETYGDWSACEALRDYAEGQGNGKKGRPATVTDSTVTKRLRAIERCETRVEVSRYRAVVRRLLSRHLPCSPKWWKDPQPSDDTEERARRVRQVIRVDDTMELLEGLEDPARTVLRAATEGMSPSRIAFECSRANIDLTFGQVRELLYEHAGKKEFRWLSRCWER